MLASQRQSGRLQPIPEWKLARVMLRDLGGLVAMRARDALVAVVVALGLLAAPLCVAIPQSAGAVDGIGTERLAQAFGHHPNNRGECHLETQPGAEAVPASARQTRVGETPSADGVAVWPPAAFQAAHVRVESHGAATGAGDSRRDILLATRRLRLDAGRGYRFRMMAVGVAHGASIQFGRGRRMVRVRPGRVPELELTFSQPGNYLVHCTVCCGLAHDYMQTRLEVV